MPASVAYYEDRCRVFRILGGRLARRIQIIQAVDNLSYGGDDDEGDVDTGKGNAEATQVSSMLLGQRTLHRQTAELARRLDKMVDLADGAKEPWHQLTSL